VAGKDIMLDPRAGIRKAGAMPPLMALLKEVVEVGTAALCQLCLCVLGLTKHTHEMCPKDAGNSLAAAIGWNDVILGYSLRVYARRIKLLSTKSQLQRCLICEEDFTYLLCLCCMLTAEQDARPQQ